MYLGLGLTVHGIPVVTPIVISVHLQACIFVFYSRKGWIPREQPWEGAVMGGSSPGQPSRHQEAPTAHCLQGIGEAQA